MIEYIRCLLELPSIGWTYVYIIVMPILIILIIMHLYQLHKNENILKTFYYYLRWLYRKKPMIKYKGFHCGCCGRWHSIPFEVKEYQSDGKWADTWGLCPENNPCKYI